MKSLCLITFLCALALATPSVAATPAAERPVRIQIANDPVSLDPQKFRDLAGLKILANTFEGLVQYDSRGKIQPRLAASHTLSKDRLVYTFKIRKNAKWSDGIPLLPSHFRDGILRALNPKTGSIFAASLFPIKGARALYEGKGSADDLGVHASDNFGELIIVLTRPCGYFLHLATMPVFFPAYSRGKDWKVGDPTPGPYIVAEREQDRRILLRRNPHYAGKAARADIELLVVADDSTAASLFETGKVDLLTKLSVLDADRLAKVGKLDTVALAATTAVTLNPHRKPLDDRALRRAIARAIDKRGALHAVGNQEELADGLTPPGIEGHLKARPRDPEGTKLADPPSISAYFDSGKSSVLMEKIQADLRVRLGIPLELQSLEWKSYISLILKNTPQMYRMTWPVWYLDPLSQLEVYASTHPSNPIKWSNARYDQLITQAAELPTGSKRVAVLREAQAILTTEEAVIIPLFHSRQQHAISRALAGFAVNALGTIPFGDLHIRAH